MVKKKYENEFKVMIVELLKSRYVKRSCLYMKHINHFFYWEMACRLNRRKRPFKSGIRLRPWDKYRRTARFLFLSIQRQGGRTGQEETEK